MKTDIIKGMLFVGAIALSSCATTQLASQKNDAGDDVYYSKAKAGNIVEHAAPERSYKTDDYAYEEDNSSNYFYDDSYASRINRFNYYTPWRSYYDNLWMSSGYYNSAYLYGGLGMGFGLGYAYSPWGLGYSPYYAYGYSPYGYSPYSYYGGGYGYGGGNGYWGPYSYYRSVNPNYGPRPARGSENAIISNSGRNNGTVRIGPDGRTTVIRGTRPAGNSTTTTSTARPTRTSTTTERPTRTEQARPARTNDAPAPRATTVERSAPSPSPSSSSGGSRSSGGSSSGGSRPSRSGGGR